MPKSAVTKEVQWQWPMLGKMVPLNGSGECKQRQCHLGTVFDASGDGVGKWQWLFGGSGECKYGECHSIAAANPRRDDASQWWQLIQV